MKNDLHKQHVAAKARGQRAVSVFTAVVEELKTATAQHEQVANGAQAQIDHLAELRDQAAAAAKATAAQATAVSQLVTQ